MKKYIEKNGWKLFNIANMFIITLFYNSTFDIFYLYYEIWKNLAKNSINKYQNNDKL